MMGIDEVADFLNASSCTRMQPSMVSNWDTGSLSMISIARSKPALESLFFSALKLSQAAGSVVIVGMEVGQD
jgi:hypothetical protein